MSTESFDKDFHITDPESIALILEALANPEVVISTKRDYDYDAENERGIEILSKRLSKFTKDKEV